MRDKNYIVSKLQQKRWVLRLFLKIAVDREDYVFWLFVPHLRGSIKPGFHGAVNYCTVSSTVKTVPLTVLQIFFHGLRALTARLFRGNDIMILLGVGLLLIVACAEDIEV